nr:helix-turn-helix domain-containing protein [Actinopolyspora biskrensis]
MAVKENVPTPAGIGTSGRKQYESGASIRALAAVTGRSCGFVHRVLIEAGVRLRGPGGAGPRRGTADQPRVPEISASA